MTKSQWDSANHAPRQICIEISRSLYALKLSKRTVQLNVAKYSKSNRVVNEWNICVRIVKAKMKSIYVFWLP